MSTAMQLNVTSLPPGLGSGVLLHHSSLRQHCPCLHPPPPDWNCACPFADINNASAGDSPKKRNNIGVFTPTSLTKSKLQEDGAKLNALELRRKRARERYASMSPKKKEARKMKARVYKQLKEDEYSGLTQTTTNYVKGSDQQHMITPRRLPFTVINNVAHYDNVDHTRSPFSCILQGATQNSHTLPANTDPVHHDNVHLEKTIGSWSEIHYKLSHCKAILILVRQARSFIVLIVDQ
uniref:Uncharacterized protein n=1 Tax=Oryza barthii TaxID=65489 RepID=A0A0D3F4K8_9ORYZ